MKYDSGGSLKFNKVFSKSDPNDPVSIRFYISGGIAKYDDSHVILTGAVQYSLSKLGIDIYSSIDQLVFKADYNFNIEWASLFCSFIHPQYLFNKYIKWYKLFEYII